MGVSQSKVSRNNHHGRNMGRSRLVLSWKKHPVKTFGGAILFVLAFSAQSVVSVGMILLLLGKLRGLQGVGSLISRSKLLMVVSCIFVACLLLSVATSVLHAFSALTTSRDAQHNLSKVRGPRKMFAAFEHAGLTSLNPVGAASDFNYLMGVFKDRRAALQKNSEGAGKNPFSTGLKKTSAVIGATVSLAGVVGLSIFVGRFYRKFGLGLGVWTGSSVGQKAAFVVGAVGLVVCFASLVGTFCLSLGRLHAASEAVFHDSKGESKKVLDRGEPAIDVGDDESLSYSSSSGSEEEVVGGAAPAFPEYGGGALGVTPARR